MPISKKHASHRIRCEELDRDLALVLILKVVLSATENYKGAREGMSKQFNPSPSSAPVRNASLDAHWSGALFRFRLDLLSGGYGGEQAGEAFIDLGAAGGVLHLHAAAFAADQPCLAERLEVLRERRFRDLDLVDLREARARLRAIGTGDLGEDARAHRIGKGVQDALDRYVLDCGVNQRPHTFYYKGY